MTKPIADRLEMEITILHVAEGCGDADVIADRRCRQMAGETRWPTFGLPPRRAVRVVPFSDPLYDEAIEFVIADAKAADSTHVDDRAIARLKHDKPIDITRHGVPGQATYSRVRVIQVLLN